MQDRQELEAIQLNLLRLAKAIDESGTDKSDELLVLVAETLELTQRLRASGQ